MRSKHFFSSGFVFTWQVNRLSFAGGRLAYLKIKHTHFSILILTEPCSPETQDNIPLAKKPWQMAVTLIFKVLRFWFMFSSASWFVNFMILYQAVLFTDNWIDTRILKGERGKITLIITTPITLPVTLIWRNQVWQGDRLILPKFNPPIFRHLV